MKNISFSKNLRVYASPAGYVEASVKLGKNDAIIIYETMEPHWHSCTDAEKFENELRRLEKKAIEKAKKAFKNWKKKHEL